MFTSGGFESLGCSVNARVKNARDLNVRACRLPVDAKTGKVIGDLSRIVRVEFENGITWTPVRSK